jgi:hypothetical protein
MNAKALCLIAGVSVLAFAGPTFAAGPMQLSALQMDTITAGSNQNATVEPGTKTNPATEGKRAHKPSGKPKSNTESETKKLTIADLIGLHARVYTTGDFLTLDYRLDRVNIALSKAGKLVRIWVG